MTPPPLILASGSATRRHLLTEAGVAFTAHPVAVDEPALRDLAQAQGASAEAAALRLAEAKAERVRAADALVIGADQILVLGDHWLGKAEDLTAARAQLWSLRGHTHGLATALVARQNGRTIWHHIETPRLTMRRFSSEFLDEYLAAEGHHILGSVGCYRLEGRGVQLFSEIAGEHSTILGLPLLPLLAFLRRFRAIKE